MEKKKKSFNRFISTVLVLLSVLFLFSSCDNIPSEETDTEPEKGQIKIYCTDTDSRSLHWENAAVTASNLDDKIQQVFGLLGNISGASHKKALPDDVTIKSYIFGTEGQMIIDFSSQYMNMSIIQETLCRAAYVKTFCQLDGVIYIEFYVDGEPLKLSGIPVGLMNANDFIDIKDNVSDLNETYQVNLFMTDENGKLLQETAAFVAVDGLKPLEQVVLERLITGPGEGNSLKPVVNEKTVVNNVRTIDGICYVDLSEDFMTKPGKISDEVAVYSVVNSLCELQGITRVKLTVNGNERKNYGKVNINDFMSLKPELIAQEKAGESTGGN